MVSYVIHVEDAHSLPFSITLPFCCMTLYFCNDNFTYSANGMGLEVRGWLYPHDLGGTTFAFTVLAVLPKVRKEWP